MAKTDNYLLLAMWTLVAVAAANWLFVGINGTNVLVELLGAELADWVFIVAGVLGLVDLAETYGLIDGYPGE